jgi:hypothetical protein
MELPVCKLYYPNRPLSTRKYLLTDADRRRSVTGMLLEASRGSGLTLGPGASFHEGAEWASIPSGALRAAQYHRGFVGASWR